jgi:serine/threonine protein kinase
MSDESLLSTALARWRADGRLAPPALLPDRPDRHPDLGRLIAVERTKAAVRTPADGSTGPHPDPDDAEVWDLLDPPPAGDRSRGRVGDYRVTGLLGKGGMGVVFAAESPTGAEVAVKLIRSIGHRPSRQTVARTLREADALRAIHSDRVVLFYAIGSHRGYPFLVMPRLVGETLETRLQAGDAFADPPALGVFADRLCEGLAAVHAAGYVHRDLKPSNVWIEYGSFPRVIDFGLALLTAADPGGTITASGMPVGTPAYMAPEQAKCLAVDGRADLFSLGCVLYRMAAGVPAFAGRSVIDVLLAVQTFHPPPASRVRPGLPAGLCGLITRLLAKSPADRPADTAAVRAALADVDYGPWLIAGVRAAGRRPWADDAVRALRKAPVRGPAAAADWQRR